MNSIKVYSKLGKTKYVKLDYVLGIIALMEVRDMFSKGTELYIKYNDKIEKHIKGLKDKAVEID